MAEHTPGPWFAARNRTHQHHWKITRTIGDARGDLANLLRGLGAADSEVEANAHLMAAAPALYEAAREILFFHEGDRGTEHDQALLDDAIELLRAAIAKAEGRS